MTPRARNQLDRERMRQSANCDISGAEIRAVRSYWCMPRAEFAEHFGVSPTTVKAWEHSGVTSRNQKFDRPTFRILKLCQQVLGDG